MKNAKVIFILIIVLIVGFYIGGILMTIFMFLMKILFGLIGLGIFILGFYLGRKTKKDN